nr:MAG TPA: hypothetical protein [Bacteriophage sp.]
MSSILKHKGVSCVEDNTECFYEQIPEWDENGELPEDAYEE